MSRNSSIFLFAQCLFACALVFISTVVFVAAADRPNIILILADDMGTETVGCYGGTSYQTPNIDRLAASGLRFEHAYATPLCTNTRIQLMTGKYNNRNWLAFGLLDPKETTFGHLLQDAGYETCIAGKWQLTSYDPLNFPGGEKRRGKGMHPRDAGFDEYSLWHTGDTEHKGSRYGNPVIDQNGQILDGDGKYGPDMWTDFITDFITRNQEQPFFVYYSMALPHWPFVPTPDSDEWAQPENRLKEDLKHASEMIEYTDKAVGRIVDHVDALGLGENTLILFYTDSGTDYRVSSQMGDRLVRGGKSFGSDAGTRVPLIVRWPSVVPAGKTTDALVDSTDFLPTLCAVAGKPAASDRQLDGKSFLPLIDGAGEHERRWVYIHHDPRPGWDKDRFHLIRFARTQRFKLYEDGRLFDMERDQLEAHPILISSDRRRSGKARRALQEVLDSMTPFPMFDPQEMLRPDLMADPESKHAFQQQLGEVIAEAETVKMPYDESWRRESDIPGYTGDGYVRSLRKQEGAPEKGVLTFRTKLGSSGWWSIAVRHRRDHYLSNRESDFWLRVGGGPWMVCRSDTTLSVGSWGWPVVVDHPERGTILLSDLSFEFRLQSKASPYGKNNPTISIAPRSPNFKVDRVVLYQSDRKSRALDPFAPQSEYHPW
jgi:arylsulfatase A-like enzyme